MIQTLLLILILLVLITPATMAQQSSDTSFPPITTQSKPWTRWWWPGSAVDSQNLTRELEQLQAAGIGGVEITPIYGTQTSEARDIEFLSPKWIEMLRHVGAEARRLEMGVDMATCTGWPFGGPMVTPEIANTSLVRDGDKLAGRGPTMKVKRAAPGGAGWVLNPYSVTAIRTYLKSFDHIPADAVRAQFHDSFEYSGNWTDELPDRFQQMHGYDLRQHVKELFGEGDPDTVARIKSDYRETLSQMHCDYMNVWAEWCRARGDIPRNQAHGSPGNLLDLYAVSDIPETETFGSTPFKIPGFRRDRSDIDGKNEPNPVISKFASSAAHVSGKPLVSSETLTWLREHFRVALSMCKPEIDQMFLAGINHIFYHGTCYSPDDAAWPGWLFYASTEINPRDSIWRDLPLMNQYIARCQSILQAGKPDNDVLLYWPIYDNWHDPERLEQRFTIHVAAQWIKGRPLEVASESMTQFGYGHDYISDMQLADATVKDGAVVLPGGTYRTLVIPRTNKIPVETLQRIISLAEAGATVIVQGALPEDVPGFGRLEQRRAVFKQLLARLESRELAGSGIAMIKVGSGRVLIADALAGALELTGARRETFVGDGVGYIRRAHERGHHYFIASLGTRTIDGWIPLGVDAVSAVLMDPLTGQTGAAALRRNENKSEIYLQLKPGQSIIVRTFATQAAQSPQWTYTKPTGEPVVLDGQWQIEFIDGAPEKPSSITTKTLASWTELGDAEAKRFAGTARYRIEFDRPAGIGETALLDLGDVRESARVRLNGREVGAAWSLPFELPLVDLKQSGNVLEIDVTNLSANRLRDLDQRGVQWRIMKEINYVNINYRPFDASTWADTPSGLLGPVRLVPLAAFTPGER